MKVVGNMKCVVTISNEIISRHVVFSILPEKKFYLYEVWKVEWSRSGFGSRFPLFFFSLHHAIQLFLLFCEFRSRLCQKLDFIGGTQTHLQKFCFVIIFIVFSLSGSNFLFDFHLCFSDRTENGIFELGVLLELVIESSNKSSSSLVTGIV